MYYNKRQAQLIIKTSIIILHRFMVANIGKFNTNKIRCDYVSTLVVVFKFKCMFYIVFERVYLFKKKKNFGDFL